MTVAKNKVVKEVKESEHLQKPREVKTLKELIDLMQVHIESKCPAMSPYCGDKTPEILAWIDNNNETRTKILKGEI